MKWAHCPGIKVLLSARNTISKFHKSTCTLKQWFPTGGTRTPRGTQAHCRGYVETFNNHLCYVILFENHQHGGTHGMTNRLRGYTRQKRLGNTALKCQYWEFIFVEKMYLQFRDGWNKKLMETKNTLCVALWSDKKNCLLLYTIEPKW